MIFSEADYDNYGKDEKADVDLIFKIVERCIEWAAEFRVKNKLAVLGCSKQILVDVVKNTIEDLRRYRKEFNQYQEIDYPDHFKQAAHLAFWIRRLRPFFYEVDVAHNDCNIDHQKKYILLVNEYFALQVAEYICTFAMMHFKNEKDVRPMFLNQDFVYSFRYKHVSPHAMLMILRSVYS